MRKQYAIKASANSKANNSKDKPNEDAYLLDEENHIYIVADGVTRDRINGQYPNPSPAKDIAELFVSVAYQYLVQNSQQSLPSDLLKQSISVANETIRERNKDYTEFAPSTVAIVSMIVDEQFHYIHIGDCSIYRLNQTLTQLTTPQTQGIHDHAKEFTTFQIRNEIANNPQHPYAYGILNGNENALQFVEYQQFNIESDMHILIASDGLDALLSSPDFHYEGQSASALIEEAEQFEQQNPHLRSDDKTAILIEIS